MQISRQPLKRVSSTLCGVAAYHTLINSAPKKTMLDISYFQETKLHLKEFLNQNYIPRTDSKITQTRLKLPDELAVCSYNVAGLRAAIKKGLKERVSTYDLDIICLQETKTDNIQEIEEHFPDYNVYSNIHSKKGYAGVFTLVKKSFSSEKLHPPFAFDESLDDGRFLVVKVDDMVIMNTYSVNSKDAFVALDKKIKYNEHCFETYEWAKNNISPKIIFCGDFNATSTIYDVERKRLKPARASSGGIQQFSSFSVPEQNFINKLKSEYMVDVQDHIYGENLAEAYSHIGFMKRSMKLRIDYIFFNRHEDIQSKIRGFHLVESQVDGETIPISDHRL